MIGKAVRIARCGAFDDDLEVARGWKVNADGTERAAPRGVRPLQPGVDVEKGEEEFGDNDVRGPKAYVTGAPRGGPPRRPTTSTGGQ